MKRLNAVIAIVALILVLSTIGCLSGSAYAERAFNDGTDSLERGLYEEAISHFDKAIHLEPGYALAYGDRGSAYSKLGQNQRAIVDYDQAIQLDPDLAMAYNNRGAAYGTLGQYEKQQADAAKACSLDSRYC